MQISHARSRRGWFVMCASGSSQRLLFLLRSGLYRAIIESLKPTAPSRRLTSSRFKREAKTRLRNDGENVGVRGCVYIRVGRKGDERDLHSECEFCMRQVRPGKYCKDNLLRARKSSKPRENVALCLQEDNRVLSRTLEENLRELPENVSWKRERFRIFFSSLSARGRSLRNKYKCRARLYSLVCRAFILFSPNKI